MANKTISVQLKKCSLDLIARNRKKLQLIIDTIILYGQPNIFLCCHHDTEMQVGALETYGHFSNYEPQLGILFLESILLMLPIIPPAHPKTR